MIRIGTRGSALALFQARSVQKGLLDLGLEAELVVIHTSGDKHQSGPIVNLGAVGVFTKEIQRALLEERIDLAVHSMKDLPTEPVPGLAVAAVPPREDVRDCLVLRRGESIDSLALGAVIGSGSLRRRCQLLNRFGDRYRIEDIRGNVETRLKKLDAGDYDAVVLAVAGLTRLGFDQRICRDLILDPGEFLPAVGQGALAIEARLGDAAFEAAALLNDPCQYARAMAERAFLAALKGGCIAPIGAHSRCREDHLTLRGRVLSLDGTKCLDAEETASTRDAQDLGARLARRLLEEGASELIGEWTRIRTDKR
ncbi:MAG: hydroxymethylbilane synthase [Thermoguttaceae bacterium]|nr:hydroxymethylbilane synthase [Thermoguttaceae bacterium]